MNVELTDAIIELLCRAFQQGQMPSRKWIVLTTQKEQPHLDNPRLDLTIGLALNHLVDTGILKRINARYYAPGDQYV